MSSPKKKLSTGPIRIDLPVSKQEYSALYASPAGEGADTSSNRANTTQPNPETGLEARIPEVRKQDSNLPEDEMTETSTLDSSSEVIGFPESQIEDSALESSQRMGYVPSSVSSESGIPESGLTETEYKKVAMRLSREAVESLRQLRATTGIPYEILVDVMIRNWDNLPQRTRAAYLQQAKQVRIERLIAGQEKTMKTMRTKYLDQ